MKIGVVTTTINAPTALAVLAYNNPEIEFFIAADEKTPPEAEEWCYENIKPESSCHYLTVEQQKDLGYKSSEIIGWNTDSRRNIAVLEALKAKCELLISWDDDMYPLNKWMFSDLRNLFAWPFSGLMIGSPFCWLNTGDFYLNQFRARGVPADDWGLRQVATVAGAQIGAWQGIILGVPDADGISSISNHPQAQYANGWLANGFVAHPRTWTVFNSQWTAFLPELAPAFAQFYGAQKRNTDIFASLLMRRIMRDRNLYTHFGPPAAYHNRTARKLFNDLQAEMPGLEHIQEWANYLDRAPIKGEHIFSDIITLVKGFGQYDLFPLNFWDAWLSDCESVL